MTTLENFCISLEPPVAYVKHPKALAARLPTSGRRQGAQYVVVSPKMGVDTTTDERAGALDLEKRNSSREIWRELTHGTDFVDTVQEFVHFSVDSPNLSLD
jgi:hypothetical protein